MKDADVIKKFCFSAKEKKEHKPNSSSNSTNEDSRELGQRIDILDNVADQAEPAPKIVVNPPEVSD